MPWVFALLCAAPAPALAASSATPGLLAWRAPWSTPKPKGREREISSLVTLACNQRSYKTLESPFPRRRKKYYSSSAIHRVCPTNICHSSCPHHQQLISIWICQPHLHRLISSHLLLHYACTAYPVTHNTHSTTEQERRKTHQHFFLLPNSACLHCSWTRKKEIAEHTLIAFFHKAGHLSQAIHTTSQQRSAEDRKASHPQPDSITRSDRACTHPFAGSSSRKIPIPIPPRTLASTYSTEHLGYAPSTGIKVTAPAQLSRAVADTVAKSRIVKATQILTDT